MNSTALAAPLVQVVGAPYRRPKDGRVADSTADSIADAAVHTLPRFAPRSQAPAVVVAATMALTVVAAVEAVDGTWNSSVHRRRRHYCTAVPGIAAVADGLVDDDGTVKPLLPLAPLPACARCADVAVDVVTPTILHDSWTLNGVVAISSCDEFNDWFCELFSDEFSNDCELLLVVRSFGFRWGFFLGGAFATQFWQYHLPRGYFSMGGM